MRDAGLAGIMAKTFCISLVLISLLLLQDVGAQAPPAQSGAAQEQAPPEDPLGRSTPRGTVRGLIMAAEDGNLERAAEYLQSTLASRARQELAEKVWVVLDRKLVTSLDRLSNMPQGDVADGLANRDRVGLIESESGNVEIVLERVQQRQGGPIWLFPASVLREIPRLYDEIQPLWIESWVPEVLRTTRWLSVPLYRWIINLLLIPFALGLAALLARALSVWLAPMLGRLSPDQLDQRLGSVGPLRLLVLSALFYAGSVFGLSLFGRQFWQRVAETLMVMALCWLSLRLLDVATAMSLRRLQRGHRSGDVALVRLIYRLLKATTVILAVLLLLYLSDVDLTAALTGLGVGGIAIGFGAQKTIENLFGGIMVISDKPVNVGDWCKVGEFAGTVEDIGIRSTRIRTLDRTVVSVPNGQLASMILENFAQRDRIRFHHTIGLAHQTTAEQVRDVLTQIRRLIESHPRVDTASARTRFIKFGGASLDLEIFAYILENDQAAFLAIQEDLLLSIMDIIDSSGAAIASPPVPVAPAAQARV